jgi:hypothetical protein
MEGKSKVKSQKSKGKSASVARPVAACDAKLLTFDFCLLTFDLPFPLPFP